MFYTRIMNDAREICIVHANCQGEPLAELLAASPQFAARWRIQLYTNYTRDAIPDAYLKKATLFLYQHLGPEWEEVSSDALLARLGPEAEPVCIPNMFFRGYWPFWTKNSPIVEFGDYLLDKLYEAGAGKAEILRVYLHGDVSRLADLPGAVEDTLAREKTKEERCAVKTTDFVAANWRSMPLFQTPNHPAEPLLIHTAQGVLDHLGLARIPETFCETYTFGYQGFCLPVHPKVAAFHGLPFAGEDTLYPVFNRPMTFVRYISRYIDCRLNHMEDVFLGYLQVV